jgi:hypothetical protein
MSMSDDVWARHTNPLSGWSSMSVPPLFVLAIWSRIWLGWWCLLPLALVVLWTWWNPRAFRRPTHLDNWMSRGVMGERIWLARNNVPIPQHHRKMPHILASISAIGLGPLAWGLWTLEIWPTLAGLTLIMGGKLWFLDRMVWLEADHRRSSQPWHSD